MINHLKRKNICPPLLEDISVEEIKFTYGFEITPNDSKMTHFDSKMTQMTPK